MIPRALLKRIDQKFQLLRSKRSLSPGIVNKLREQLSLELTYNSNALEGNKLTLKETFLVINDGLTVKGRSLKDHLEAKNHNEAVHFLYDLIEHQKRQTISERLIRSLQQLIIKDIEDSEAGRYRQGSVMITGSKHRPPESFEIPKLMQEFVAWAKKNICKMHPVEFAAQAHHRLVHIHPFTDGNGRTARLLMNLLLMQKGYPIVIILKNDRQKYYRVLEKADAGKYDELEKFVAQAVERSMNIYLKAIQSSSGPMDQLILLSELSKYSRFSEKYLNLLVRSGKLEAHKESRNWVSSKTALENYLAGRERKRDQSIKVSPQPNISDWLKGETPYQRKALEAASRHFDKNDVMDVHTLEALYGQESSFGKLRGKRNSNGAAGDFQIKKNIARDLGLKVSAKNDERFDLDASSAAAAKYLKASDTYFRKETILADDLRTIPITDLEERKKIALAAYNAGSSRIAEAQKLALEAGQDPTKWDDVEQYLEKAGASRAQANETRDYVNKILGYEKEFDKKSKADPNAKYKRAKPIDPYPSGGHWITKDGRHILIRD